MVPKPTSKFDCKFQSTHYSQLSRWIRFRPLYKIITSMEGKVANSSVLEDDLENGGTGEDTVGFRPAGAGNIIELSSAVDRTLSFSRVFKSSPTPNEPKVYIYHICLVDCHFSS